LSSWSAAVFRRALLLLVAPLSFLLAGLDPGARAWAVDLPTVAAIEFEGAASFPPSELRDEMHTKVDSFWYPLRDASYRRDILLEDLDRIATFYRDHGHRDVRVKLLTVERLNNGKQVAIRIGITEGPVTEVSAVTFGGVQTAKRESVADVVETKVGEPYSATRVTLDRLRLLEFYADRGRPFTTIQDSVLFDSTQARVHFQITEGSGVRIRNLTIEGAQETKPFVIKRELKMKKGDLLRRSQVVESRERLLETGFFRDVRFQPVPLDSVPPVRWLDLKVSVVERPMGWVSTGVGFSSSEELRLSTEIGQRNIFGNAQRIVGRGRVAFDTGDLFANRSAFEEARVDLAFFEPWLFSTRTQGTVTLFGQSDLEPELPTATVTRITREDAAGFELAAERRLYQIRGGRMRFRGAFENRWVRQEIDLGTEGASEPDSVPKFVTRSVSFFVERDRRDNPFDPGRGSHTDFLAQVAGGALGGTSSFVKVSLSGSWYRPWGQAILATRLRGGLVLPFSTPEGQRAIDQVPREERFRAGGSTSVRGYPEDSLGPQTITAGQGSPATDRGLVTLLGNVELRFPLRWKFSGAIFLDAGNVWEEARDVAIADFFSLRDRVVDGKVQTSVRYSGGGGLRFGTPVGPLRLDYGYGFLRGVPEQQVADDMGGEWHLSLGQAF
jgi:outer membrane protein assembly complex protein YaeT